MVDDITNKDAFFYCLVGHGLAKTEDKKVFLWDGLRWVDVEKFKRQMLEDLNNE